jgi:hypothetical protein
MPKKSKSRSTSKTTAKRATAKSSSRKKSSQTKPAHIELATSGRRVVRTEVVPSARRVVRAVVPIDRRKKVEEITTTTDIETVPTVEVRRPATLSQALTERAVIVEKPKTRVVGRTVKKKRVA